MPTADQSTAPLTPEMEKQAENLMDQLRGHPRPKPMQINPALEKLADMTIDSGVIADKELRVALDAALQKLKALSPSRERSLSITKIQEAIMWLGMDLKRLNDTRPYPSSYDPTSTKVEPTADGLKL